MPENKQTHVRYLIIVILFVVSCFSYGDRVAISIAGAAMAKDISMDALKMGFLLSGFSWAYVLGQLPSGSLLDRFGSKRVYGISIILWSLFAFLTGFAGYFGSSLGFTAVFILRLLSGFAQAPVFPGNGRIVASWFPTRERGRASAIFNSSQYFALLVFAPIFGWLVHVSGWRSCFWFMGALGMLLTLTWFSNIYGVKQHPSISQSEIELIESGGGLVSTDQGGRSSGGNTLTWATVRTLLSHRMFVGVYVGQYCITTLTWFFLTWFPIYLAQARHMSILKVGFAAAVPGLCGGFGGILGGVISDRLLKGHSLSFARKVPIMAGMALSMTMIACNYASSQALMITIMSLSFFGKGIGALGWTVISDTSPKGMVGMNGALFNVFGNMAGITTPIIIGTIVQKTGSFDYALIFVSAAALCAIISYGPLVGEIKRLELGPQIQATVIDH